MFRVDVDSSNDYLLFYLNRTSDLKSLNKIIRRTALG
jgi:hypothetical protein